METHLEHEMKKCLEEMENLQTKAKELQQQKIEQDTIRQSKKSETGPNMSLMKEWLDIYNDGEEYSKIVKNTPDNTDHRYRCNCDTRRGGQGATCKVEACKGIEHNKLELRKGFETNHCDRKNVPSEFMKDFIEATYNLFQIQQKRIEELEDKINVVE
jgi:hypothetical protein